MTDSLNSEVPSVAHERGEFYRAEKRTSAVVATALLGTSAVLAVATFLALAVGMEVFGLRDALTNPWSIAFDLVLVALTAAAGLDAAIDAIARRPLVVLENRILLPRKRRIGLHFEEDVVSSEDILEVLSDEQQSGTVCTVVTRHGRRIRFHLSRLDRPSEAIDRLRSWRADA